MVALDDARTDEDFKQCVELLAKTHPDDESPNFGYPMGRTFIIFDTEDRSKVRGLSYTELVPEIRLLSVDPEYRFQDASRAMLQQFSDAHRGTDPVNDSIHRPICRGSSGGSRKTRERIGLCREIILDTVVLWRIFLNRGIVISQIF